MEQDKEKTIEQSFQELDGIISRMQSEELSLEEAFSLYKSGIAIVEGCNRKIEKIQCDIEMINAGDEE